jgi:hypothetical protein
MVATHGTKDRFSTLELYIKGEGSAKTKAPFEFGHIPIADLSEYGFSLQEIYPKKKDQRGYEIFGDFYTRTNMWPIESKEGIDRILHIGDSHDVPFLVILKITDRGELLVNVERASGSELLEKVVSSYPFQPVPTDFLPGVSAGTL